VDGVVWMNGLLMSMMEWWEQSAPWWQWGYGMGRHKLQTTNTIAFYLWQFECTEIQWRDPEAHVFKGICDQQMHICIPSHVKSIDPFFCRT
jgi:hypothetical protein